LEEKAMDQQDNADRIRLNNLITKAETNDVMSQEEVGFVEILVSKFRSDLDAKLNKIQRLEGEISQLRSNEKVITDIIKNLVSAAAREKARLKAEKELRQAKNHQKDDEEADN